MTNYENAPATELLATHCCVCNRPLLDSVSVEFGIGPECRKKHGFNIEVAPDARAKANQIVNRIAKSRDSLEALVACEVLKDLGFVKLSETLKTRLATIVVTLANNRYLVKAPYSPEATEGFRAIYGRQWDRENKLNSFPESSKAQLFQALKRYYPNHVAIGPKGPFVL